MTGKRLIEKEEKEIRDMMSQVEEDFKTLGVMNVAQIWEEEHIPWMLNRIKELEKQVKSLEEDIMYMKAGEDI